MNDATMTGMRNLWAAATKAERTMTARQMALTSWGKVHANVNVDPSGDRWVWDARRSLFVA